MKNITLAVDDTTYRNARRRAAERSTSVSGLVRDYLHSLEPQAETREDRAKALLAAIKRVKGYSASNRLTREQAHDRQLFR